ncbi:MAG TPA: glycosyltransferase family 39 protein, partial [Blastocatellia bacterium]|nr:glycosyltransferase family 39 protein [Blastocatellia bacterium]
MGIVRGTVHQLDNRTSRQVALAALGILVAALLVRVIHLDADPSALLSRDFITDEGWWAHNARNALLYGEWKIDEFNQGLYSAYLYNALLYLTLKLLGVSFFSIRLVPSLAGWLSVVLVFLTVRREINLRAAIFASVLLGFSNLHIIYSRIGLAESTIVFFLALMLWLWSLRRTHYGFALLSGVAFALMLVTKVTGIYFMPGFILLIAVGAIRHTTKKHALVFLLGSVLVGAGYAILFVLPNFREWLSVNVANGAGTEWSSGPLTFVY